MDRRAELERLRERLGFLDRSLLRWEHQRLTAGSATMVEVAAGQVRVLERERERSLARLERLRSQLALEL